MDSNTKIVGDFNTLLLGISRSSRQRVDEEAPELNYSLDQIDQQTSVDHSI
jgi:hypothetical protein